MQVCSKALRLFPSFQRVSQLATYLQTDVSSQRVVSILAAKQMFCHLQRAESSCQAEGCYAAAGIGSAEGAAVLLAAATMSARLLDTTDGIECMARISSVAFFAVFVSSITTSCKQQNPVLACSHITERAHRPSENLARH